MGRDKRLPDGAEVFRLMILHAFFKTTLYGILNKI